MLVRWAGRGIAAGALMVAGVLAVGAAPALAVGDAGLSKVIIANPVPGWQAESTSGLNGVVSYIDGLESDSVVPQGGNAVTAVQGWRDPNNSSHYIVVALLALRFPNQGAGSPASQTQQAAVGALASLCAGLSVQSTVQTSTIAGIPGSHTLTCTLRSGGSQPYAAGWARSNVLALVLSTQGSVTSAELAGVANSQYAAMPASGYAVAAPGSGLSTTFLVLLAVLVVLAVVAFFLWRVLRREQEAVEAVVEEPVIRRGVVQRPASLAGGVPPTPTTPTRPQP